MTRVFIKRLLVGSCVLASVLCAFAVSPKFWELLTQEDLFKGKLRGVSLSSDGRLLLAPQFDSVFDANQALVFSMTADPSSNIYLGTGHEGRVFKVDPKGTGSLFFKADEIDVFAMACDSQGNLYVGTSPDGKVYKVASNGKGTEFFDPKDKYIWDLAFDKDGTLFVSTGGKGLLYRVDKTGNGSVLFDSDEAHLMSLAFDLEGNVIAGSSPSGQVYRISKQGKAFVILDTPMTEVRRVAVDRLGNIYAAAIASSAASAASLPREAEGPSPASRIRPLTAPSADGAVSGESAGSGSDDRPTIVSTISTSLATLLDKSSAKSMVYRIAKDGGVERLWSSTTELAFDFVVRDDGRLLLGTGNKGRILAVEPQRTVTILAESAEEQVTRLLPVGNDVYAATSNMGKLWRLQPARSKAGEYESDVFDSGMPSAWGQISWKASVSSGSAIEIFTRSGNTSVQNKTWSEWAGPYQNKEGEAVKSPAARYLQWKAVFKSAGAERKLVSSEDSIEGVTIAYLQQNMRPQVTSVSVLSPGVALQKLPSMQGSGTVVSVGGSSDSAGGAGPASANQRNRFHAPPRRTVKTGAQSFTWKGVDENDDDLLFDVYFKGENETEWKLLDKELEDDFYTVDSNNLPDGVYTVRIVATDAPSNPYGKALTGEIISKPFVITNSTPVIEVIRNEAKTRRVEITYRAKDAAARIYSSEFSIDGGSWYLVFPKDGIADSRDEEYVLLSPELTPGEHILGLRVTDGVGNVGTHKLIVKVP